MKKYIMLFVVGLLAASCMIFTGCGNKGSEKISFETDNGISLEMKQDESASKSYFCALNYQDNEIARITGNFNSEQGLVKEIVNGVEAIRFSLLSALKSLDAVTVKINGVVCAPVSDVSYESIAGTENLLPSKSYYSVGNFAGKETIVEISGLIAAQERTVTATFLTDKAASIPPFWYVETVGAKIEIKQENKEALEVWGFSVAFDNDYSVTNDYGTFQYYKAEFTMAVDTPLKIFVYEGLYQCTRVVSNNYGGNFYYDAITDKYYGARGVFARSNPTDLGGYATLLEGKIFYDMLFEANYNRA